MSRPIDIPGDRPSTRPRSTPESSAFPSDDGPYFGYIEVFETGDVQWTVSSGFDKYVEVGPQRALPSLAFIVEKDRVSRRITIEITSLALKQYVYRAILNQAPSPVSLQLDFDILLKHYEALKLHSQRLETRRPHDAATAEMRLLVNDLLLERALYEGIGMEGFRQRRVLCMTHLQDIHLRNLDIGLDEIEDCFSLGLIPDEINEDYMNALNARYAEFARSGDYDGLHNLCEPIVRSGEIELQYNPSLLLEVLDRGHMDIYLYMLELVDRTRDNSMEFLDPNFSDVTLDPFYVAIRLGQHEAVHSFARDGACFEGRVYDDTQPSDGHIFTPLLAAVFWNQPDIVRILLTSGPVYFSGYQQALALALAGSLEDILQIFTENQHQSTLGSAMDALSPSRPQLQSWEPSGSQNTPQRKQVHDDFGTGRSISAITNSLSSLASQDVSQIEPSSFDIIDPQWLSSPGISWPAPSDGLPPEQPPQSQPQPEPQPTDSQLGHESQDILHDSAQPTESPHPFVRQRPAHQARRKLGRELVLKLDSRCVKLRELCQKHSESATYTALLGHFSSMENVWECGIEVFRHITRNKAPTSLVEILQCLVVADTLSWQISQGDVLFRTQFINDLGRWRAILKNNEQPMFDEIIQAVWGVKSRGIPHSGADEAYYFKELIQNIVSLEEMIDRLPRKDRTLGARLQNIRRRVEERRRVSLLAQQRPKVAEDTPGFQNISSVLGRLTKDTDSADEEEIDLGDFIHLDALQEEPDDEPQSDMPEFIPSAPWKDIHTTVVFLLASVAFSIVLILVSAIQDSLEDNFLGAIRQLPPGYGRSCAIVENFLDFKPEAWGVNGGSDLRPLGSDIRPAALAKAGAFIPTMKASVRRTSRPRSLVHSLAHSGSYSHRSSLRASVGSPSGSSFLSTDLSSTDVDAVRSSQRFRCLHVKCPKSFSSLSNRNKHMREGCAFRDKKGYRCRNDSCTKVLTTKWYRNTHEQTRCRHR